MGVLQRILKNLGAMLTGNVVNIITEFLLPPVFLARYGVTLYADWLVLTVSVTYLNSLNFGIQTYMNQDLAMRFSRGERGSFHSLQSTALRLLVCIAGGTAILCLVIFAMPVERLLRLSIPHSTAAFALYFIAMQLLLTSLIFGYFAGSYISVGKSHRGTYWTNAQQLINTLTVAVLAWMKMPLSMLAGAQAAVSALFIVLVLVDLKRTAPEIFPTLRYWDGDAIRSILRESGYFGLIQLSTFLSMQLPVVLLQRFAGPTPVVILSLMRKIFGFGRKVVNGMTQSMGPEITRIFGAGDWRGLVRLYIYSERFIFTLIAMMSLGLFYGSPLLLRAWVHKPELFVLGPYTIMAAVNIVLCVKEHKYQFQFTTNTHVTLARVMFWGYVALVVISLGTIHWFGLSGFLWTWLAIEVLQTWATVELNKKLFAAVEKLEMGYVFRLAALAAVGLAAGFFLLWGMTGNSFVAQAAADVALTAVVGGVAYLLFGMNEIRVEMTERVAAKLRRQ